MTAPPQRLPGVRDAARGSLLLLLTGLVTAGGNLAFHAMMAGATGTNGYGELGALLSFATVASFVLAGVQYAVAGRTTGVVQSPGSMLREASRSLVPWMVAGVALAALSVPIAGYLGLRASSVLLAVAYCAALVAVGVPAGILTGQFRFVAFTVISCGGVLLRLLLGWLLRRVGGGVDGGLMASAISAALWAVLSVAAVVGSRRREPLLSRAAATVSPAGSRLAVDAASGALLVALLWSTWAVPLMFAQHSLSRQATSSFAAAHLMASGVLMLTQPLVTVFYPMIARHRSARMALVGLGATLGIAVLAATCLVIAGPLLVDRVYGPSFHVPLELFARLAVSATIASGCIYGMWASQARRGRSRALVAGVIVAFAVELALGATRHASTSTLATQPGIALLLGGAVAGAVTWLTAARRRAAPVEGSVGQAVERNADVDDVRGTNPA